MPPPTRHVGRAEVVTDTVRTTQVAYLTGAEARAFALSGRISVARQWWPDVPYAGEPPVETVKQDELESLPDLGNVTVTPDIPGSLPPVETVAEPVTLSAAVEAGILPMTLAAVRTARHREDAFPKPVARHGLAHLYDPVELDDWFKARSAV
jgi:hypothetical protein